MMLIFLVIKGQKHSWFLLMGTQVSIVFCYVYLNHELPLLWNTPAHKGAISFTGVKLGFFKLYKKGALVNNSKIGCTVKSRLKQNCFWGVWINKHGFHKNRLLIEKIKKTPQKQKKYFVNTIQPKILCIHPYLVWFKNYINMARFSTTWQ